MQFSDAHDKIAAALVAIQKDVGNIVETDSENPFFKRGADPSKYASLGAILSLVGPAVSAHGCSLHFDHEKGDEPMELVVTLTVLHESGQWVRSGPLHMPYAARDPQKAKAASSYGIRTTVAGFFAIAQQDDDGNEAAGTTTPASKRGQAAKANADTVPAFWSEVAKLTDNTAGVRAMLAAIYSVGAADLEAPTVKVAESLSAALTFMRKLDAAALADKLNKYASA